MHHSPPFSRTHRSMIEHGRPDTSYESIKKMGKHGKHERTGIDAAFLEAVALIGTRISGSNQILVPNPPFPNNPIFGDKLNLLRLSAYRKSNLKTKLPSTLDR